MSTFVSAQFPGAIATDTALKIAENGVLTALRGGVTYTDTTWTVGDASRIVANMLLTCGTEIVNVTSVSGNNITVQRGFDGTTAQSHNNNSPVFAAVDAWHHNALAAEVKAIETALGVNLSNVGGSGGGAGVQSTLYNFSAQTPGGSLVVGANSITLAPVPQGVNGSNVAHYLYISGGTGTAEAVPIIGGSAVAGQPAGTIIVTCANTHSGNWTIRSATAGIQEAVKVVEASGSPASVIIPNGIHTVYAATRVRNAQIGIRAESDFAATIDASSTGSANVFEFHAAAGGYENNSIRGLKIDASGKTAGIGVSVSTAMNFHADKMVIYGCPDGIVFSASYQAYVTDCWIYGMKALTGRGISYDGGANLRILRTQCGGDISGDPNLQPLAGIEIKEGGGIWITDVDVLGCGKSLYVHPGAGKAAQWGFVSNSSFDTGIYGVYLCPDSTGVIQSWNFTNSWCSSQLLSGVALDAATAAQVNGVSFVNHRAGNNRFYGFDITQGANITISDSQIWGNNQSLTANITGIQIHPNLSNIKITGCSFAAPSAAYGNHHAAHIAISAGTGNNIIITDNDCSDTVTLAPILFEATGTKHVIHSNLGVNTAAPPTIASASTLSLGTIPYDVIAVTGTTTVNNITPGWEGREVAILKSDAGTLSFSNSGNIVAPFTLDQGDVAICWFANGGWWCK